MSRIITFEEANELGIIDEDVTLVPISEFKIVSPYTFQLLDDYNILDINTFSIMHNSKLININKKDLTAIFYSIEHNVNFEVNTIPIEAIRIDYMEMRVDFNISYKEDKILKETLYKAIVEYITMDLKHEVELSEINHMSKSIRNKIYFTNPVVKDILDYTELMFGHFGLLDVFKQIDKYYLVMYLNALVINVVYNLNKNNIGEYSFIPVYWASREVLFYV